MKAIFKAIKNLFSRSPKLPTIYCSLWVTEPYEGTEVVKYWWHPDEVPVEQFQADVKKCIVEWVTEWMDSDEDYRQFDYIHNQFREDSEYWQHWMDNDVLEGRMAKLGYRKCFANFVWAEVPMDEPTRDLCPEEWEKYLGPELYARVQECNAQRQARWDAQWRKEVAERKEKERKEKENEQPES